MISMIQILQTAVREKASDIHITEGAAPSLRINGSIVRLKTEPVTEEQSKDLCYSIITDEQKKTFEEEKDLDFSFSIDDLSRFRGHLYYQKNSVAGCFRQISSVIPSMLDIGLPPIIHQLTKIPYGLVLVTGPTGSGKTTTLAAMLEEINKTRKGHILTIEDPIEYIYSHKKCLVNQREIGFDAPDFHKSLRAALRTDPDICLLGELRDKETVEAALHTAETGHLTFATLHTNNVIQTIDRIAGVFDGEERQMIYSQLAQVLQGVISQKLLPTISGKGRVPAIEILFFTPAIRNLIKEGKQHQIYSVMQTQRASGMSTLNQSLLNLVKNKLIDPVEALSVSYDEKELDHLFTRAGIKFTNSKKSA